MIHFGGVSFVSGSVKKVQNHSIRERDENHAMRFGKDAGDLVLLTGQDIAAFFKGNYGIDYPPELLDKSQAERQALINADPAKYNPVVWAVHSVSASDAIDKAYVYAKACEEAGECADGTQVNRISFDTGLSLKGLVATVLAKLGIG